MERNLWIEMDITEMMPNELTGCSNELFECDHCSELFFLPSDMDKLKEHLKCHIDEGQFMDITLKSDQIGDIIDHTDIKQEFAQYDQDVNMEIEVYSTDFLTSKDDLSEMTLFDSKLDSEFLFDRSRTPNSQKPLVFGLCDGLFSKKSSESEKIHLQCSFCRETFSVKELFEEHTRKHLEGTTGDTFLPAHDVEEVPDYSVSETIGGSTADTYLSCSPGVADEWNIHRSHTPHNNDAS